MSKGPNQNNGKPSSRGKGFNTPKSGEGKSTSGKSSKDSRSKGNPSKGKPSWSKGSDEKSTSEHSEHSKSEHSKSEPIKSEKGKAEGFKSDKTYSKSRVSAGRAGAGKSVGKPTGKPAGKGFGKRADKTETDINKQGSKPFEGQKFEGQKSDAQKTDYKKGVRSKSGSDYKKSGYKKEGDDLEGAKTSEFKSKYNKDHKKPEYGKKAEYGQKTEYGKKRDSGSSSIYGKKPEYGKKINPYKAKEVKSDATTGLKTESHHPSDALKNEKWDRNKSKKGPRQSKGYGATQVSDASFQGDENRRFIVKCSDMAQDGKGIVTIEGEKYFLSNVIEGETVLVEMITKGRRKYVNLLEIKEANAFRVTSPCEISSNCGGCQLQHLSYAGQLHFKQSKVNALLSEYGRILPIIGMENPAHYRNKVNSTFSLGFKSKIISGIFEEESHNVISVKDCLIQDERANAIIETIRTLMPSFKMMPYDEDAEKGFLRHVLIRTGHVSGEVMVVLVVVSPMFPEKNHFVKALTEAHPEIKTIVQNVNHKKTSMVLGDKEVVLYGKGFIEDTLCDTVFRISSKSFYQVNPIQTEILYNKAIEMADLTGKEVVLDAYSGIGTISLIASRKANHVVGIELNNDAVKDAISNAKRNNIENARFYNGDAGDFMRDVAKAGEHLDVVFMDPPRSGSDEIFLNALVTLAPKKVVYISCNPLSLARDLKVLVAGGYQVEVIQPVDMFPGTWHTEVVVKLERR
ncbi:23S rRNA (uracil(1939)-C(5))-methyltransferase RlmD [Fusibacter sp. 3D3]|uniref:23S rRNA (uracil(1939)-C(5))-methyltransferase RlmD n=1 Tax=Fusibacter sp. 3D3 TaxID=1048380 RepID=UPI001FA72D2C|nr:23S rRNA (uracil(1939)-C(5))-methyltransferase RlmD [Fusibacter sp. 3D3]